ncbi:MAG: nucleotidyltransferase domain-containing protein [Nanoarchaeota archaeon]
MDYFKNVQLDWLKDRTIFLSKHGSHAYGMNTEFSDLDIRGVAVPPKEYYFGYLKKFEQCESKVEELNLDLVVFDITKFIKLCSDGNPNALEILFTDPSDHIIVTKTGQKLLDNKNLFLSKKIKHTLSGYAYAQLQRIIRHKSWLMNPILIEPTREQFGLVAELSDKDKQKFDIAFAMIKKQIAAWTLDFEPLNESDRIEVENKIAYTLTEMQITSDTQFNAAARTIGFNDNFINLLDKERAHASAKTQWKQYNQWVSSRNPKRAILEEKSGYDTKHASHLVRLLTMCAQVLETGNFQVKRPDAEFLLSIRNGAWSYEQLLEFSETQNKLCEKLYFESNILPKEPNRKGIEKLCIEVIEEMI